MRQKMRICRICAADLRAVGYTVTALEKIGTLAACEICGKRTETRAAEVSKNKKGARGNG